MVLLLASATKRFVPSFVIPRGRSNKAAVPVPSVVPAVPAVPARVVTTPVEITILRIVLVKKSVTYRFVPSFVIPNGILNKALVPVASVVPEVPAVPARVVTTPVTLSSVEVVVLSVEVVELSVEVELVDEQPPKNSPLPSSRIVLDLMIVLLSKLFIILSRLVVSWRKSSKKVDI
jgi:hypothetical protein